jgi:hypothetical protein
MYVLFRRTYLHRSNKSDRTHIENLCRKRCCKHRSHSGLNLAVDGQLPARQRRKLDKQRRTLDKTVSFPPQLHEKNPRNVRCGFHHVQGSLFRIRRTHFRAVRCFKKPCSLPDTCPTRLRVLHNLGDNLPDKVLQQN